MKEYHKIQSVFKRDQQTNRIILGDYSVPEFAILKDITWVFTEKVDGTNIRVMWDGQHVTFGGKTDRASLPTFLFYRLQELFDGISKRQLLSEVFESDLDSSSVCLYGEGYGAKIQKHGGSYKPYGVDFVLFDVKIGNWWLERHNVEDIAHKLELRVAPIIGSGTLEQMVERVRNGFNSEWGPFPAEGIVARPQVELFNRQGHRIITKLKHKDFA